MASQHAPTYNFPLDMSPDNSPIVGIPGLPLVPSGSVSPSITSRSMPHDELLTPPPIIRPLFIDNLVKDFNLDASHRARLLAFVKVVVYIVRYTLSSHTDFVFVCQLGSIGMGMSQADLATRLYMLAVMFADEVERRRATTANGVGNLSGLYADLKVRLEDTFMLTSEQKVCPHMSHFGLCGC